jgi:hypothetical protein
MLPIQIPQTVSSFTIPSDSSGLSPSPSLQDSANVPRSARGAVAARFRGIARRRAALGVSNHLRIAVVATPVQEQVVSGPVRLPMQWLAINRHITH